MMMNQFFKKKAANNNTVILILIITCNNNTFDKFVWLLIINGHVTGFYKQPLFTLPALLNLG